jgi:hypothetical protein
MNPRAIQRAIVRMMYDPAFVAAVHGPRAVPGLGEDERALLRRVDRRAFATDRFRRARAVHAIVDEYPVGAAAIGLAAVEGFLGSREFQAVLTGRDAMALAFGTWLADQASGVGRIEAAMAGLRRAEPPSPAPGALRCAPNLAPLTVPAGSLAWYEATLAWLGPEPLRTLAGQPPRPGLPRRSPVRKRHADEHLLIELRPDGGMSLGTASEPLVRLLRHAATPRSRAALTAEAVTRGATPNEAPGLLDGLVADGLLVAG